MTGITFKVEENPPGTVNPRGAVTQTVTVTITRTVSVHWSHLYCGITHGYLTAKPSLMDNWVTVTRRGETFDLAMQQAFVRGRPRDRTNSTHPTLAEAKAAGAAWLASRSASGASL